MSQASDKTFEYEKYAKTWTKHEKAKGTQAHVLNHLKVKEMKIANINEEVTMHEEVKTLVSVGKNQPSKVHQRMLLKVGHEC